MSQDGQVEDLLGGVWFGSAAENGSEVVWRFGQLQGHVLVCVLHW